MTKLYTAALIFIATFTSCAGSDKQDYTDKELQKAAEENKAAAKANPSLMPTPAVIPQPAPGTVITPSTQPVNLGTNGIPVATATPAAPVVVNAQPNVQQPTAPGMNPPHGQPGHRCDIAIGAPLNSKPVQNPTPVQITNPTQPTVVPVNLTTSKPDSVKNR